MHDYSLEHLNTRSFEQLVQALALKILGPNVLIFGDGPDGGREATFDYLENYPSSKRPWKGRGIVQAKFRQRPASTPKDNTDWLISQITHEESKLSKLSDLALQNPNSTYARPRYYIIATNISLSSVSVTGGKDRLNTVLKNLKRKFSLTDYAIWDRDQICRYLDGFPDIRQTYNAWLLPGDVLAELLQQVKLTEPNFKSIMIRHLQAGLLEDQFARLREGGYTLSQNISLSSVFIDLPITDNIEFALTGSNSSLPKKSRRGQAEERTPDMSFLSAILNEGRVVLKPSNLKTQIGVPFDRSGRIVLLGGPGQGKTTASQYVCQLYRSALLKSCSNTFSPEIRQALTQIDEGSRNLPVVGAKRYPLKLDLKTFARWLARDKGQAKGSIFRYLVKDLAETTASSINNEDFRKWLSNYPWIIVLDGLDEVPSSSNRQEVMSALQHFISIELHETDCDVLILATTRPQGYSYEFDRQFYKHLVLLPLNPKNALAYGSLLAKARHHEKKQYILRLNDILSRAVKNEATARLMQSPLQVTIMLSLIEAGGEPPDQRWKLFSEYYRVIYRREIERDTQYSDILREFEPDIHWIHHRIGWLLQQKNAKAGDTDARLTHQEFKLIVTGRLKYSGHLNREKLELLTENIKNAATDRLVLLVGNTEKEIGFEIRSIQEFMAAEHFFDGGEACIKDSISAAIPFPYWRNVALFAAGRIFFDRLELIANISYMCEHLNENEEEPAFQTASFGSRSAIQLLKEGAIRNRKAPCRILTRIAARSLASPDRALIHEFLEIYAGECEDVLKEEVSARISASSSPDQPCWRLTFLLANLGVSWAIKLVSDKYPWEEERSIQCFSDFAKGRQLNPSMISIYFRDYYRRPLSTYYFALSGLEEQTELWAPDLLKLYNSSRTFKDNFAFLKLQNGAVFGKCLWGRSRSLSSWSSLDFQSVNFSGCSEEWNVCKSIWFLAKSPSIENLLKVVTTLQKCELDQLEFVASKCFPWQVSACIRKLQQGSTFSQIEDWLVKGSLGSPGEWLLWESAISHDLYLENAVIGPDLSVTNDCLGLVLSGCIWGTLDTSSIFLVIDELSNLISVDREVINVDSLVGMICLILAKMPGHINSDTSASLSVCIGACLTKDSPLHFSIIKGVFESSLSVVEKGSLLTILGQCTFIETESTRGEPANYGLSDYGLNTDVVSLVNLDDCKFILHALKTMGPHVALEYVDESLFTSLLNDGKGSRKDVLVLLLYSGKWNKDSIQGLVVEILEEPSSGTCPFLPYIGFLKHFGRSGPAVETFLDSLIRFKDLGVSNDTVEFSFDLLVKLLDTRPTITQLPDPVELVCKANGNDDFEEGQR